MQTQRDRYGNLFSLRFASLIFMAGVVGQVSFEAYAWIASPPLFGVTLEPANLVTAITAKLIGINLPYSYAFLVHLMIGAIGFPLIVLLSKVLAKVRFTLAGAVAGVVLWFVAQGILDPYIGRSFMMDFGSYTQSSFVGHVVMSIIIGLMLELTCSSDEVPVQNSQEPPEAC